MKETFYCLSCGKKYIAYKHQNKRWCSASCHNKSNPYWLGKKRDKATIDKIIKANLGKKHIEQWKKQMSDKWKGGVTSFQRQVRNLPQYREWKTAVLKRDCLTYPVVSGRIQVHHKKPFNKILIDNNIKTLDDAKTCQELWDVSNGIALWKGEHAILSILERHKHISKGLICILQMWINENDKSAYKKVF